MSRKTTKTKRKIRKSAVQFGKSGLKPRVVHDVVKNTTKNRDKKPKNNKEVKKIPNPDGNNQTTPSDKWYGSSYADTKTKLKIYYEHHPELHMKFIESLVKNAIEDPKWAKMVVEMTGGFDPTEAKVTGEVIQIAENPLNSLSVEELRTIKALKVLQNQKIRKGKSND